MPLSGVKCDGHNDIGHNTLLLVTFSDKRRLYADPVDHQILQLWSWAFFSFFSHTSFCSKFSFQEMRKTSILSDYWFYWRTLKSRNPWIVFVLVKLRLSLTLKLNRLTAIRYRIKLLQLMIRFRSSTTPVSLLRTKENDIHSSN